MTIKLIPCILISVMSKNGLLNEPVLTLNANFEPLNVCTTKRALMLVLTGKAEIIINGRGYIRSASAEFEFLMIVMGKELNPQNNM